MRPLLCLSLALLARTTHAAPLHCACGAGHGHGLPAANPEGGAPGGDAPPSAAPATDWDVDAPHGPVRSVRVDTREATWASVDVHHDVVLFDMLGDIWSVPLAGGEATRLTQGAAWDAQPRWSPDGTRIVFVSDRGGNENLWVMDADGTNARAITQEGVARVTSPQWDPTGQWIVARRRTVDTRSIGVTELWQWHLEGGAGMRLTSLDAHPHAGEASFSPDGRWLYFSSRGGRFEYDHNPLQGLWSVWRIDRTTGEQSPVVTGAGGASRPLAARDGRTLLFVSRERNRSVLEALDTTTGARRLVHAGLDRDEMEAFALHDTYPGMGWVRAEACGEGPAWTCDEVVLWGKGRLWRVTLDGRATEIPFHAAGDWQVREPARWTRAVEDSVTARVIRWPTTRADGVTALSAMGRLWLRAPRGAEKALGGTGSAGSSGWTPTPAGDAVIRPLSEGTGYAPAWSPDGGALAWTSWSNREGGRLHVTTFGKKGRDAVLPLQGQLVNPAWSADARSLVVLRGVGGGTSPDLAAESHFEIVHATRAAKGEGWSTRVVTTVGNRGSASRATRLHLHEGRVYWMEDVAGQARSPGTSALVSVTLDGLDKRTHLDLPGSEEVAIRPDFGAVAYKAGHDVYVTAMPPWGGTPAKVGDGPFPVTKLTDAGGDWLAWTPDGAALSWSEGETLVRRAITGIGAIRKDDGTLDPTPDPTVGTTRTPVGLVVPRAKPAGVRAITHARAVTMNGDEVIEDATIVIDGDRIVSVTKGGAVPAGATVLDAAGRTAYPGLIDVHAHLHYTAGDVLPDEEWRYRVALDFGVTTVQDPSASSDTVFTQAERVEAGFMQGPRVHSTGGVLYGALSSASADTPTPDAARGHVRRLARMGAGSVKVYQQSQRERRQWYVQACEEQKILCVPEGGGDTFQNLGMVVDGFHAIEHALPNAPLYGDVIQLWKGAAAGGGAFYTPTLLVAYGGLTGENYYFQNHNPVDDARLRRNFPRRELDAQAWRWDMHAMDADWNFMQVARDAAALQDAGVHVTLGAHGQLQGLGVHWELWSLASPGAMTPHEALRAGTLDGARYLGLQDRLGSLEPGKLADIVLVDGDPLKDIHDSVKIWRVVKNGAVVTE